MTYTGHGCAESSQEKIAEEKLCSSFIIIFTKRDTCLNKSPYLICQEIDRDFTVGSFVLHCPVCFSLVRHLLLADCIAAVCLGYSLPGDKLAL